MRKAFSALVEEGRVKTSRFRSKYGDGHGAFIVTCPATGAELRVIVSDGVGWETVLPGPAWEHVSVSLENRCPTWEEMVWVKSLFFLDEETVIQFHPPASKKISVHPYCLHLWRLIDGDIPMPPKECIA